MVYEARPNVTADAAGICIRTGNACILRGGSLAYHSCAMIAELLADALEAKGFPREAVSMIESTDREATGELMKLRGIVDVLIPRGGAGLIQRCVRESLVPVIETGTGSTSMPPTCWKYVNCVTSMPLSQTSQPRPQAPRVGLSQSSSTKRTS